MRFQPKELYAPARIIRNVNLIIGLIFLVLASIFFYFLARGLTRPMGKVVEAARQIAAGDLSVEIPRTESRDEIGELTLAFDQMVGSLKERHRQRRR